MQKKKKKNEKNLMAVTREGGKWIRVIVCMECFFVVFGFCLFCGECFCVSECVC
jgi:hypothetical protein